MQFSSSGFPHKSNNGINKWSVSFKINWMRVKNLRIKQRKNTEQMKLYIQRAKMKKLLWHSLFFSRVNNESFLNFWGKVCSKTLKLKQNEIISQNKSISALSLYWTFLLIVWLIFFLTIYVFNDTVIAWCKALLT